MKAIFVSYNQAYANEIVEILDEHNQRGFTSWENIHGRGHVEGEPHYGDHAWPTMNNAILTMVPDELAPAIMADLHAKDEAYPDLGLRAFQWNIETMV